MRGVTSSLASSTTSPVAGSTTSAAANAPSSSASEISTDATPAALSASIAARVTFFPARIVTSEPGTSKSFAARRPASVSLTAHARDAPFVAIRSTE